jgi:hypothetical protein
MNPGFVRCPLCGRPTKLVRGVLMTRHYATRGKPGGGFATAASKCEGSNKRPEDVQK